MPSHDLLTNEESFANLYVGNKMYSLCLLKARLHVDEILTEVGHTFSKYLLVHMSLSPFSY
jgi:hypothetical protein